MTYLSVCSGIEAATVAWHPLGWRPLAFAEIDPFACAVLAHHYPEVPNLGDLTCFMEWPAALLAQVDLLVGGPPCQSFSFAGLGASLADPRGQLSLVYVRLLNRITAIRHAAGRPAPLCVWENVPGVLNKPDNPFGCLLGGLAGSDGPLSPPGSKKSLKWSDAGYVRGPLRSIAWRSLDAQYFRLAQRRQRVFLVAGPRDDAHPEQVLFERESLRWDSPPRRGQEEGVACDVAPSLTSSGRGVSRPGESRGQDPVIAVPPLAYCISGGTSGGTSGGSFGSGRHNQDTFIPELAHALRGEGHDASEDGTGRGTPLIAFPERLSGTQCASTEDLIPALCAVNPTAVAFNMHKSGNKGSSLGFSENRTDCLRAFEKSPFAVMTPGFKVRRLTPTECLRLQGFPDDYLTITYRRKPAKDGPKYKAIGNSMAVPVMRWIGERIEMVARLQNAKLD